MALLDARASDAGLSERDSKRLKPERPRSPTVVFSPTSSPARRSISSSSTVCVSSFSPSSARSLSSPASSSSSSSSSQSSAESASADSGASNGTCWYSLSTSLGCSRSRCPFSHAGYAADVEQLSRTELPACPPWLVPACFSSRNFRPLLYSDGEYGCIALLPVPLSAPHHALWSRPGTLQTVAAVSGLPSDDVLLLADTSSHWAQSKLWMSVVLRGATSGVMRGRAAVMRIVDSRNHNRELAAMRDSLPSSPKKHRAAAAAAPPASPSPSKRRRSNIDGQPPAVRALAPPLLAVAAADTQRTAGKETRGGAQEPAVHEPSADGDANAPIGQPPSPPLKSDSSLPCPLSPPPPLPVAASPPPPPPPLSITDWKPPSVPEMRAAGMKETFSSYALVPDFSSSNTAFIRSPPDAASASPFACLPVPANARLRELLRFGSLPGAPLLRDVEAQHGVSVFVPRLLSDDGTERNVEKCLWMNVTVKLTASERNHRGEEDRLVDAMDCLLRRYHRAVLALNEQ